MTPASAPVADPQRRMRTAAILPALAVVVLWAVFLLDRGLHLDLARYGILPREWHGLIGIVTAPFIHGDLKHLFNNSVPVFVLGWALMYFYPRTAGRVALASWLLTGLWVWISARPNYHIGASGVVYGMAAFLFTSGVLRRQRTLMALSLLVVFLYGGMVWGLFPIVPRISWESHLWGAVVGVIMAGMYRTVPPAVSDPVPVAPPDDDDDEGGAAEPEVPVQAPARAKVRPMRIVYHLDPGDEVDDEELAWRRALAREQELDPGTTSDTWYSDEEYF